MVPIRLKLEIIYQKGIILYPNVNKRIIAIAAKDVIIPLTKASSGFSRQLFIDSRSFNLQSFAISLRYATRLGLWQSWADTECIKYGIMQVGSLSIWQKWYATTSLARISIEFDIEVAEMWKKYVVTGHWYCYLIKFNGICLFDL